MFNWKQMIHLELHVAAERDLIMSLRCLASLARETVITSVAIQNAPEHICALEDVKCEKTDVQKKLNHL